MEIRFGTYNLLIHEVLLMFSKTRSNLDMGIKNPTEKRDPMGERSPLMKSHIPSDEIH